MAAWRTSALCAETTSVELARATGAGATSPSAAARRTPNKSAGGVKRAGERHRACLLRRTTKPPGGHPGEAAWVVQKGASSIMSSVTGATDSGAASRFGSRNFTSVATISVE